MASAQISPRDTGGMLQATEAIQEPLPKRRQFYQFLPKSLKIDFASSRFLPAWAPLKSQSCSQVVDCDCCSRIGAMEPKEPARSPRGGGGGGSAPVAAAKAIGTGTATATAVQVRVYQGPRR